jgi:DNA-binding NarL/FixJ family response regulator
MQVSTPLCTRPIGTSEASSPEDAIIVPEETSPPKPVRILIVDDHPAVREGLAQRIATHPDLTVCGEAADVAEALGLIVSLQPDVAIIDIALREGNGIDLVKRIRARACPVRMLVLSMYDDTLFGRRALRAGAMGYINKAEATDKIIDAIRRVLEDKVYLSEPMVAQMLTRTVGNKEKGPQSAVELLSDRELEVFKLIGQGRGTQEIADAMHLSGKTVETYRSRIKEKLELNSAVELVQRAVLWTLQGTADPITDRQKGAASEQT